MSVFLCTAGDEGDDEALPRAGVEGAQAREGPSTANTTVETGTVDRP